MRLPSFGELVPAGRCLGSINSGECFSASAALRYNSRVADHERPPEPGIAGQDARLGRQITLQGSPERALEGMGVGVTPTCPAGARAPLRRPVAGWNVGSGGERLPAGPEAGRHGDRVAYDLVEQGMVDGGSGLAPH